VAPAPPGRVLRILAEFENLLITLLLIATVLTILAQVFYRYALNQPLSWSNEIATDLLVYLAFVGFAIGVRDNAHVTLHLFDQRLAAGVQRWMRVGELVVLGAVLAGIGWGGARYAAEQNDVHSPIGLPLWVTFAALPLGGLLGLVHVIVEIVTTVGGPGAEPGRPADLPGAPAAIGSGA
jgi:TRAP-type C4-dicarboxylate transport system permease small subunit